MLFLTGVFLEQYADFLKGVHPERAYRLLNIVATGIVSAVQDGVEN